jgi:hypothetical protein
MPDDPDGQIEWEAFYASDPSEAEIDAEEYFYVAMNKDD